MSSDDESPADRLKRVPIVEAVHPANKPYFRQIATSKQAVREGRANLPSACSNCANVSQNGQELQRCGRCKMTWYCSKDCQKKHWPAHKTSCKETPSSIPKMITSFMANKVLLHHLEIALIMEFDIGSDPDSFASSPFVAKCEVGIEPADMTYIMQLVMGRLSHDAVEKGCDGMLQVKKFTKLDKDAIDETRMEIWKNAKENAKEKGFSNAPIGLVDFAIRDRTEPRVEGEKRSSLPFAVTITDDSLARVKAGAGFEYHSALMDLSKQVPLSVQSAIDFMNMHIRSDKKNQLRLRTHLSKQDIQKLRESDLDE
ncbi:hypothetical protein CVT26_005604 [Gymnopilus dilepis]|uniref:MYND-type domain-containing protein n=1 Tax=Gymnopilus dilepis TaxID=231916 RepID=A0A409X2W3_9AGAR|nr:hypothetical protein CVT26_005604 [Gymnopilus dilepis]